MNLLRACWSGGFRGRGAEKNDIAVIWRERIIEMTHTILIPGAKYWAPARQVGLWDSGQSLLVSEGLPRRDDLGARLRDGLLKTLHIPVRQAQTLSSRRLMVTPRGWSPDEQTQREAEREVEELWGKPRSCSATSPVAAGSTRWGTGPACPWEPCICLHFPPNRIK